MGKTILILIDYQPKMLDSAVKGSGVDGDKIMTPVIALAEAAELLKIPTIITTINEVRNGKAFPRIVRPGSILFERKSATFDSTDDDDFQNLITKYAEEGYDSIVIGGLWTSICMGFTAISLAKLGWNVTGIFDGCADITPMAHHYGLKAMTQAGVVPSTWITIVCGWIGSWKHPKGEETSQLFRKYGG